MFIKKLVPMSLLAVSLLSGGLALAGARYTYPVTVVPGARYAYGSMGSARNSVDTTASIMCYLQAGLSSAGAAFAPIASCSAGDAAGNSGYCSTNEPQFVDAVRNMVGSDSYINFTWNAYGTCTEINVYNGSYFEPKK